VGQGKTLVSFLLPEVLEAERPLLIVPGKLLAKTRVEFAEIGKHWKCTRPVTIVSYERISTDPDLLNSLNPDLIIADEAHKLKEIKAACTKRVKKYYVEKQPVFVPMSGTLAKRSFMDWWLLQLMALPYGLHVLPMDWRETARWGQALDEKTKERTGLGALKEFGETLDKAREGYGQRLRATPGVIASDTVNVGASLQIGTLHASENAVDEALELLAKKWELPDGTELMEAVDIWRHSREIANGFYYRWVEEPPAAWREARREANAFVRYKLRGSRKLTAPAQVLEKYASAPEIRRWKEIKDTFKPETEAVWLTEEPIRKAVELLTDQKGLLWYEHKAVGQKLSGLGIPVFGSQGAEIKTGQSIVSYSGTYAACSTTACSEGFNLQRFDRNFILNCTPTGDRWEQLLGRTHRPGQQSDTVEATLIAFAPVQLTDLEQARADAAYVQATTGQAQKLVYADYVTAQ
jgi:hypothetical protein